MADYSIWVIGETTGGSQNFSFENSDGDEVILDGITQGDGSHLVGTQMTLTNRDYTEVNISDDGTETNFADNDGGQTLNGDLVMNGQTYDSGMVIEAEYQFVIEDADGNQYTVLAVNIRDTPTPYATNEAIAFVGSVPPTNVTEFTVISAAEGPSNSGSNAVDETEIVPVCFVQGTLIETDAGPIAVEDLQAGAKILRPDGSFAVLKMVLRSEFNAQAIAAAPQLRPVRITSGALGGGLPKRDLCVSRQHRVLVTSAIARRMFGSPEVLVPAIRLTALPGVYFDEVDHVIFHHLVFQTHEIILSEGAPTESLYPGPVALSSMDDAARAELLTIFPDIENIGLPDPARPLCIGQDAKRLINRHVRQGVPIIPNDKE